MADVADYMSELRHMVLSFRVSELQVLLGFAGRNKSGRKDQLQSRALDLLKLRSAPIHMKIKELFKRYPAPTRPVKPASDIEPSSNTVPSLNPSASQKSQNSHNSHSMSSRSTSSSSNPSHSSAPLDYTKYCLSHSSSSSSNYPVHPDVKFKSLPFYDVKAELLKPASLVPTGSSRFQEANFVFHLTPQQAHDIAMSRDLRPGAKIEHSVQVQMRFCLLETSCEQEDNFPPSICVKVNGKMCPLPNPIPTNKPGVEPKRPSRPVNVTFLCKLSPTVSNQVNVSWASEYGRGYAIGIYLVKKLTSSNLLMKLKSLGVRNAAHTRALIKEKLAQDADSEIATTSLRVSLLCPLGKMRMQIPCRASTCSHLQCFDASLYIQMNEKKPTWICPVCDKPASFETLVIDGLFMEIFNATTDCNEIQFLEDGSWSPLHPKKETHVIGSPVVPKPLSSSTITLTSSNSSTASNSSSCSATSSASKSDAAKFEIIDLTVDDSSDDDEPPKKTPAPPYTSEVTSTQHQPSQQISGITLRSSTNYGMASGLGIINPSSTSGHPSAGNIGHSIGSPLGTMSRGSPGSTYRDTTIIDSPSPIYYPPATSPYPDYLQSASHPSSLYNFPGYDLFNLLGSNDIDRQVSQFGLGISNIPSSTGSSLPLTSHKSSSQPPASPDVISLD